MIQLVTVMRQEGFNMKTVALRVPSRGFADAMRSMREWLDQNRRQAVSFAYNRDGDDMVVQVGFATNEQADAFAARFEPSPLADQVAA